MPKYNVAKDFWRGGHLIAAGSKASMTKAEAKYLGHILSEDKPVADPEAAPAPVDEVEVTPIAGVAVTETTAQSKRSKRQASAENVDSVN
ncbi:hypothetical protein [Bradyrhizobium ottawaense]|uniref:Uncharacterized protein n=1 Tax=Bradyrhizobium ottawaense TaxID=931866 RepID=A0ABY0QH41_9BRAD|nr:hypothetical protein [Bradyrhizobium ottawaense]SDK40414.1 hypothetical protein SAMN05444163_8032 [Bradyrhizobium ottawaense]